jgi:hypothetical protein
VKGKGRCRCTSIRANNNGARAGGEIEGDGIECGGFCVGAVRVRE